MSDSDILDPSYRSSVLKQSYIDNDYSFPNTIEKRKLAERLGLSMKQVKDWYYGARRGGRLPARSKESEKVSKSSQLVEPPAKKARKNEQISSEHEVSCPLYSIHHSIFVI